MSMMMTRHSDDFGTQTATLDRSELNMLGAMVRIVGEPHRAPVRLEENRPLVVGSAKECDIVLEGASVSRRHAELRLAPQGILVTDLGSRNGTFYVGQRVDRILIVHGAHVLLGDIELAIHIDEHRFTGGVSLRNEYRGILGGSQAMRELFWKLERIEGSRMPVLVNGESGVGKELVARAIHEGSGVTGPLVTLNCGAIPRDLIASELFGHRRGAYTGAQDARRGAFELADGGTLFLDEIGELPLEMQPPLLRALENGEIRPVGAEQSRHVNVRVIAATNRDLGDAVHSGTFREDLFYRLAVVTLAVPSLRVRAADIPDLAEHFVRTGGLPPLPLAAIAELTTRSWPGNVRELRNAVQSYSVFGSLPPERTSPAPSIDDVLATLVDPAQPYDTLKEELLERFHKAYLPKLMEASGGNRTQAARISGLDRTYIGRLLTRHHLDGRPPKTKSTTGRR